MNTEHLGKRVGVRMKEDCTHAVPWIKSEGKASRDDTLPIKGIQIEKSRNHG